VKRLVSDSLEIGQDHVEKGEGHGVADVATGETGADSFQEGLCSVLAVDVLGDVSQFQQLSSFKGLLFSLDYVEWDTSDPAGDSS